jgi:hypothetical protein
MDKILKGVKTIITKPLVLPTNSITRARATNSLCLLGKMIMQHLLTMLTKAKKIIRIS